MVRLTDQHLAALNWFQQHVGNSFTDAEWFDGVAVGQRLATKAKGIYKPSGFVHALSIRVSDDGPYRDGSIQFRADGTWSFRYNEETNPSRAASELFTNQGLMHCISDGVPVGVIIKTSLGTNGVEYEIGGLGLPASYVDGYFLIEGPYIQDLQDGIVPSQRIHVLGDERVKTLRSIVQRQGQGMFRRRLLEAYGGRCALTNYDAESALEAAHIRPYSGPFSNDVRNGLLLRSDIHTLFDLRKVGIEPRTKEFVLCGDLKRTRYSDLDGQRISLPVDQELQPGPDFLRLAWNEFCHS